MNTRQILRDLGRCLRDAAAPLITLGSLVLAQTEQADSISTAEVHELFLVAWRAAMIATLLWFLVALIWALTRPLRDRRAFQRLQHLREMGAVPGRALVHVQTTVWSSTAGQQVVVVNVATGVTFRVWLPETTVPIGSFAVLEQTNRGVRVVGAMNANHVEAAHRHERRHRAQHITSGERGDDLPDRDSGDDARQLIEETERFLKEQEYRW